MPKLTPQDLDKIVAIVRPQAVAQAREEVGHELNWLRQALERVQQRCKHVWSAQDGWGGMTCYYCEARSQAPKSMVSLSPPAWPAADA